MTMNEQQQVRQEIYGLLAHLFRIAPDQIKFYTEEHDETKKIIHVIKKFTKFS